MTTQVTQTIDRDEAALAEQAAYGVGLVEAMVWSALAYTGGKQGDDMSVLLIEHGATAEG